MRTIAILNLKGGVAKTTTAINMAAILSGKYKQRVLLIDADSQCNASDFFGADPEQGNLADVLQPAGDGMDGAYGVTCIQHTEYENFDILPASDALMDLDLSMVRANSIRTTALLELTEHLVACGMEYDFAIVDCPPAFSAASAAALLAADEVIIPIKLDAFSLRGMANLMRQVAGMRQINPRLRVGGCLITMRYPDADIDAAEQQLRDSSLPVYSTSIRRSDKMDKMTFDGRPLYLFSPRSACGVDYGRFVREYLRGGVRHG